MDDEDDIRSLVKSIILKKYPDALIAEASSGTDASLKIDKQKFDLIITDLSMPKKTGQQLLMSFKKMNHGQIPRSVIIYSAYVTEEHRKESIEGLEFLAKPSSSEEIESAIDRAVALAQSRKAKEKSSSA